MKQKVKQNAVHELKGSFKPVSQCQQLCEAAFKIDSTVEHASA